MLSPIIIVPRGFAHDFAVLSKTAIFQYKCDFYAPQADGGISIKDESLKDFDSPFSIDMNLYPEF